MKSGIVLFAGSFLMSLSVSAQSSIIAQELQDLQVERYEVAQKSTLRKIVCIKSGSNLTVKTDSLRENRFQVPRGTPVKVFQGWGDNRKSLSVRGKSVTFVKVQFPTLSGAKSYGWIAEQFIATPEECSGAPQAEEQVNEKAKEQVDQDQSEVEQQEPVRPAQPTKPSPKKPTPKEENSDENEIGTSRGSQTPAGSLGESISGLNDSKCCRFPLNNKPTSAYTSGMRRFGAGRSGGRRLHGASDLYRHLNEKIYAVADGVVLRDSYHFYQQTTALEVKHEGGFIVRYGENTFKNPAGIRGGKRIKAGQHIAYMGKVNSNCCEPMLHFELYSGTKKGSLSTGGNSYSRRSDLLNPTKYLLKWEDKTLSPMK